MLGAKLERIACPPPEDGGYGLTPASPADGWIPRDSKTATPRTPPYVIAFAITNAAAAARLPTIVVCSALFQGPAPV